VITVGDIFGMLACWWVIDLISQISKQRHQDKMERERKSNAPPGYL
jgi:hypothetical protein